MYYYDGQTVRQHSLQGVGDERNHFKTKRIKKVSDVEGEKYIIG